MTDAQIVNPTLAALLDIMTSTELPEERCVEAAKAIVEYEAPAEIAELAHKYLLSVAQNPHQKIGLKLEALRLMRKAESRRVVPGVTQAVDTFAAFALGKRIALAKRRLTLIREHGMPLPEGWADDVEPVKVSPFKPDGIADRLGQARDRQAP